MKNVRRCFGSAGASLAWLLLGFMCMIGHTGDLSAREARKMVYLVGEKGYAILEVGDYADPTGAGRVYLRSSEAGRFIEPDEAGRVVDYAHFFHVRETAPWRAGFSALWHMDAGAEYTMNAGDSVAAARSNERTRWAKVGLVLLTAFTWNHARLQARDLAQNPYLPADRARDIFRRDRAVYYASGLGTLGYFSYVSYRATSMVGQAGDGSDLRLRERLEVPGISVPGMSAPPEVPAVPVVPTSHVPRGTVEIALSFPVDFSRDGEGIR